MKCFLLFSELLVFGIELFKPLCIPEKKEEKLFLALNSVITFSLESFLWHFSFISLGNMIIISTNIMLKIHKASVSD